MWLAICLRFIVLGKGIFRVLSKVHLLKMRSSAYAPRHVAKLNIGLIADQYADSVTKDCPPSLCLSTASLMLLKIELGPSPVPPLCVVSAGQNTVSLSGSPGAAQSNIH